MYLVIVAMEFRIFRTSDRFTRKENTIEINTLEDLQELYKTVYDPLIIDFLDESIEIYDDYRE